MPMKKLIVAASLFLSLRSSAQNLDYPYQAVNFTNVKLTDNFWLPRIKINHTATIPASFERCEATGRVRNFDMAAAREGKFCTIFPFDDTDIYKTIEGASFSMRLFPDKKMDAYVDSLIVKIAAAQEPDGYLYTARTIDPKNPHSWAGNERWVKERELSHELYNSGHLYEAAYAHYYATGKKNLLNIALKNADLVCSVFGENKLHAAPGHQIVEMGLVKLYRITGKKEYLNTAKFFIEERGRYKGYDAKNKDPFKNGAYWQDHIPVVDQKEAVGHAVRAGYLYAGIADVAALTGDSAFLNAIDAIWNNMAQKKIYVQGGLGAVGSGERFGDNYELPNSTAYNETCAAISNVYWNHRMFLLHGDAKYIDILEKTLYNGLISGIGLDGKTFFYSNAMQVNRNFHHHSLERTRSGWFDCSCCPTNVARFIPSIPGYVYAQKGNSVYVNLFMQSEGSMDVNGQKVTITQQNNYPWQGDLKFIIQTKKKNDFEMKIRIPGWARGEAMPTDLYSFKDSLNSKTAILVNGKSVEFVAEKGYSVLKRSWKNGDVIEVKLPMEIRKVASSENVRGNIGKLAVQRGPLMYCAEGIDNNGKTSNILLPVNSSFTYKNEPGLLNGVILLEASLPVVNIDESKNEINTAQQNVKLIPYFSWANRGKSEMNVWFPSSVKDVELITTPPVEENTGK
jgi:hypothetical protein